MAFTTKYRGTFYTSSGATVKVDIQKDGYTGSILPLTVKDVNLSHNWNDYFEPAIGAGCEVEIVNGNSQWDYYDELLTAYEKQFKMLVYFTDNTFTDFVLFEGYLLSEVQEQKILKNSIISLKASNYIKQLDGLKSIAAYDEASLVTPMKIIAQILTEIGLGYDIYVNSSLYDTNMVYNHIMTELYIQRHFFWENEEPVYLLEALNKILVPFNMYVYAYNQRWYIDRWGDIYESGSPNSYLKYNPSTYSVYSTDVSSSVVKDIIDNDPSDFSTDGITTTWVNNKAVDIVIRNFKTWAGIDFETVISAITAINCNTLDVEYTIGGITDNSQSNSLTYSNISYANDILSFRVTSVTDVFTSQPDTIDAVSLYNNTSPYNSVTYSATAPVRVSVTPDVLAAGVDFEYVNQSQTLQYGRGYKNITVRCDEVDSHNLVNEYFGDAASHSKTSTVPDTFEKWYYDSSGTISSTENDRIIFNHTIEDYWRGIYCVVPVKAGTEGNNTLRLNYRVEKTDMGVSETYRRVKINIISRSKNVQLYKDGSDEWATQAINTTNGATELELTDLKYDAEDNYYYWEVNEYVDLSALGLSSDDKLEIRLLGGTSSYANYWSFALRKIRITQESTEEEIVLEGDISNNYSGTLNVDVGLFDTAKKYGLNAMFLGTSLSSNLTSEWLDKRTENESPTRSLSLQEHLLEDMYQQYNKPRKKLVASIRYDKPLKPFSIIKDSNVKRDGSVVNMALVKYSLNVPTMTYDIEADEYVINDNLKIV